MGDRITIRLDDDDLTKLDAARGVTARSAFLRLLLRAAPDAAGVPKPVEAPSRAEIKSVLAERARAGSIPAIRELRVIEDRERAEAQLERLNSLTRA
jgi:hypothetical protein